MDRMDEGTELLPAGWSAGRSLRGGGQANVSIVRHEDGREGVYRMLRKPAETRQRERFRREVEILTKRVRHRSVVSILAWDAESETPWYIAERGDPFERWWPKQKAAHSAEAVVGRAVWSLRQLVSALAACHEAGIVHRDVKPKNVVVKRGVAEPWPILIDFGVAHDNGGERLTAPDEAVGNARFSPDVMRTRVAHVRPWLDVFDVGQLLIWMLDEGAPKAHWQRPVHWNHAQYPSDIGEDALTSVRAFTAACSTESAAPRDGAECLELLGRLFDADAGTAPSDGAPSGLIARARRRGTARKRLVDQALAEEMEASAPLAQRVYGEVRQTLLSVCADIAGEAPVRVDVDAGFGYRMAGATDLLWLRVGEGAGIHLRLKCKVVPRSDPGPLHADNVEYWRRPLPGDAICFTFAIEGGVVAAGNTRYLQGRWLTIRRDGGFYLHTLEASFGNYGNNDLGGTAHADGKRATMADVREFAVGVLTDEEYWTYVATAG